MNLNYKNSFKLVCFFSSEFKLLTALLVLFQGAGTVQENHLCVKAGVCVAVNVTFGLQVCDWSYVFFVCQFVRTAHSVRSFIRPESYFPVHQHKGLKWQSNVLVQSIFYPRTLKTERMFLLFYAGRDLAAQNVSTEPIFTKCSRFSVLNLNQSMFFVEEVLGAHGKNCWELCLVQSS